MRKVNQSCRIKFFLFFHSLSLSWSVYEPGFLLLGGEKQISTDTRPQTELPPCPETIQLARANCIRCLRLIETLNQSTRDSSSCWASLERIPRRRTGLEIKELLRILKRSCSDKSCLLTVALLREREREKVSLERFTAYHTQNAKRWHTHTHTAPENFPSEIVPFEGEGEGKLTVFDKSNLGKMWSGERGGGEAQKTPTFCALLNENNHNVVYGTTPDGKS